jgi:hypothetical protein
MNTILTRTPPSGPDLEFDIPETSSEIENVSNVPGDTVTDALNELETQADAAAPYAIPGLLEGGADNAAIIQAAIDAAAPQTPLLINAIGDFYISKPLRLTEPLGMGLAGMGAGTKLTATDDFAAGPLVMIGPIRGAANHGAALLDDADFSYNFEALASPYYHLNLGTVFFPKELTEFFLEMPFAIDAINDGGGRVFFGLTGSMGSEDGPFWNAFSLGALGLSWLFDDERLYLKIKIGGVFIDHFTTSTFHTGLGERHMLGLDYDAARGTVLLFIDGVLEDTNAASGTFNPGSWEMMVLGGNVGGGFPAVELFTKSSDWRCGGFYFGNVSQHSAGYTVNWNVPTPDLANGDMVILVCQDDREEQDLIRVDVAAGNSGWFQVDGSDALGLTTYHLGVENIQLKGGPLNIGVEAYASPQSFLRDIRFQGLVGMYSKGNSYLTVLEDLQHLAPAGSRWGLAWGGGLCPWRGRCSTLYTYIGVSFQGGGPVEQLFAAAYQDVGVSMAAFGGVVDVMAISDENAPNEAPCGLFVSSQIGVASQIVIENLTVDVMTSDVTIPVLFDRTTNCDIQIKGAFPFLSGLTTPPAYLCGFTDPDIADPVFVDITTVENVPVSDLPQKIVTRSGPAGQVTLTDADVTVTTSQALAWNFDGVTLAASRVVTLSNIRTGDVLTGTVPAPDGVVVTIYADACTFAGNTITIDNWDGDPVYVFDAPGWAKFQFSRTTGDWTLLESSLASAVAPFGLTTYWQRYAIVTGGVEGPADDVILQAADTLPSNVRPVFMVWKRTASTGSPESDLIQIRNAAAGAGTLYLETAGPSGTNYSNTNEDNIFDSDDVMYLRRSDSIIGGILYVLFAGA